jgi:hypothetical protein
MSAITWTAEELAEFDRLIGLVSSRDQMTRLSARIKDMPDFIAEHGKEKCDAMWAHLEGGKK